MKTMYILGSENAGIESESLKGLLQMHKVGLEAKLRIHDSNPNPNPNSFYSIKTQSLNMEHVFIMESLTRRV